MLQETVFDTQVSADGEGLCYYLNRTVFKNANRVSHLNWKYQNYMQ